MGLFEQGRTMVRIAVNEMQSKTANPNVPYGPEEVAANAIACAARGASIVHFDFELADARILSAFALEGIIRTPVLVQLNFFWDLLRGPTPTVEGLDAFLAEWRRHDIDSEVCLFVRDAPDRETYESLLDAALDRG